MTAVRVGDQVVVFDLNGIRLGQPDDGWPGEVVRVGRKLLDIRYAGVTETFRLTGTKNDQWGHRYFLTATAAEAAVRRRAAVRALRTHGVELAASCALTIQQIEALVAVLPGGDAVG